MPSIIELIEKKKSSDYQKLIFHYISSLFRALEKVLFSFFIIFENTFFLGIAPSNKAQLIAKNLKSKEASLKKRTFLINCHPRPLGFDKFHWFSIAASYNADNTQASICFPKQIGRREESVNRLHSFSVVSIYSFLLQEYGTF